MRSCSVANCCASEPIIPCGLYMYNCSHACVSFTDSFPLNPCPWTFTLGIRSRCKVLPYSRVVTPPSLLRPPPLQREVTAKGHFLLPYTPPHLHMHTCVWIALTSMFTLVLRCYYVVIFAKCVRLFPCGRLRTY